MRNGCISTSIRASASDGHTPAPFRRALRRIRLDKADAFVSATRGDNRNVMAAQIAKHIFGVKVIASRVFDPLREEMYRNMGLRTINPTRVQTTRLKRVIEATSDEEANEMVHEFMRQDGY